MEGASKVQVAETGNKRKGPATEEDIRQAINDINNWFLQNHKDSFNALLKQPSVGGSKDDVAAYLSSRPVSDVALSVVLELCPVGWQLLDTFKIINKADFKEV